MRSPEKPQFEPGHEPEFSEETERVPEETVEEKELQRWEEDVQEIEGAKRRFGEIFDDRKNGQERIKKILTVFESDKAKQILESNLINGDEISKSLEQCLDIKDREEFINKAISSLEPLFKLRKNNPEAFEELAGIMFVELGGFTKLNKRLSYGESKDLIHIHLAPIKELLKKVGIDGIIDLIRDALEKLAEKVEENEKIDRITATSWIIAKKPTRERLKDLGFTLEGEITPRDKQKHHKDDPRKIHRASIKREEFLKRYLEK